MTALKIIKGAKGQHTNLDPAYRALEPDICDMLRAVQVIALAEEHDSEVLIFAIEQCLRVAEELKATYYEAYKA